MAYVLTELPLLMSDARHLVCMFRFKLEAIIKETENITDKIVTTVNYMEVFT